LRSRKGRGRRSSPPCSSRSNFPAISAAAERIAPLDIFSRLAQHRTRGIIGSFNLADDGRVGDHEPSGRPHSKASDKGRMIPGNTRSALPQHLECSPSVVG
jgi:hypothetical protein